MVIPVPPLSLLKGTHHCFKKTLRNCLYFAYLYVLDIGKKGPFFRKCQQFRKKGYFLNHFSLEKGYYLVLQLSVFLKKKFFFPSVNISERGHFLI